MLDDKKKLRKKDWVKAVVIHMIKYMWQNVQEMGSKSR